MADLRRKERKQKVMSSVVRGLAAESYQIRPYFPDLLKQPDLLIIPELGRMIVIFLYLPPENIGWHSAIAWVEDLIEVKLEVGAYAIVAALVLGELDDVRTKDDVGQLLRNTFDGFFFPEDWKPHFLAGDLQRTLIHLNRKSTLLEFLERERKQVGEELSRFDEDKYRPLVEKEHTPAFQHYEAQRRIEEFVTESLGEQIERRPFFPNIKGHLGRLRQDYGFEFDVGIRNRQDVAIDVIQAGRYGVREKLRYLTAKARLLRYEVDGGQLRPRSRIFRPILIVDGNISGPNHDPYRYIRALLSVGWELLRIDDTARLEEMLENGHV